MELLVIAMLLAFTISYAQSRTLIGLGSDHIVHLFLVRQIKQNKHRLFVTIPRLLNTSYCSAYPLFLHWCLSFLSDKNTTRVAKILNGAVNVVLTIVVFQLARDFTEVSEYAGHIALIFALTPQFYHGFSARSYGISARPVGILLFAGYLVSMAYGLNAEDPKILWIGCILFGYLVIGFNVIAMQAMVLMSLFLAFLFSRVEIVIFPAASAIIFVLIHRAYGYSYLVNTFRFINAYRKYLAPVFILKQRHSVWRDWVYDFWKRSRGGFFGLSYVYTNPITIVGFLNPLSLISCWAIVSQFDSRSSLEGTLGLIALSGFSIFLLTSFRATRFLGEPERYVEIVTGFHTVNAAAYLYSLHRASALWIVVGYYLFCNIVQYAITRLTEKKHRGSMLRKQHLIELVTEQLDPTEVRFAANNEENVKHFMTEDWQFARFNSAEQNYAGYTGLQAFSEFPRLRSEAFEKLVETYRINICLIDKKNGDLPRLNTIASVREVKVFYEDDDIILYRLIWQTP